MNTSEQINELAAALAKAQAAIQPASKDKTNPAFRSRYADLASVWDACRAALAENGLSVVQIPTDAGEGRIGLITTLLHSSGQWISGLLVLPLVKNDPQGAGSALTYARRYALSAMVGVVADEDDDGNSASGRQAPQQRQTAELLPATINGANLKQADWEQRQPAQQRPGSPPAMMSDAQAKRIYAKRNGLGYSKDRFIDWLTERKFDHTRLTEADADKVIGLLIAEENEIAAAAN